MWEQVLSESDKELHARRSAAAAQLAQVLDMWTASLRGGASLGEAARQNDIQSLFMTQDPEGFAHKSPFVGMMNEHFMRPIAELAQTPFDPALAKSFAEGLKAYQGFPSARPKMPSAKAVWNKGTTRLHDYGNGNADAPAVLVVPSLINRFDILDLAPDHSFLRFLAGAGLRPFVLDWGEPGEEEKEFSLADYIFERVIPAADYLAPRVSAGRLHVVGYCMGGLLALALSLLKPERAQTLVLLATPWNFASAGAALGVENAGDAFIRFANQVESYLVSEKIFPAEAMRLFFASLQPQQIMEKFVRFSGYPSGSAEAHRFVLSEDWLNDGVPLSAKVARECLRSWYGENRPGKMQWRIADRLIDPRNVACPAYVVAPGKDKLVPPESARPLARLIRGASLHEPDLGHIGLLTSHVAPQDVWAPLALWLLRR